MSMSKFLSVSLLALICVAGPAATRLSAQQSEPPARGAAAAGGDKPADKPADKAVDKAEEKPAAPAAPAEKPLSRLDQLRQRNK